MKPMKIVLAACIGWALIACSQQKIPRKEIPSVVINGLKAKYPNADNIGWEKEDGLFVAEFEMEKSLHEIWINTAGEIVQHGEEIDPKDLPDAVQQTLAKDYEDYQIHDVDKLEKADVVSYEVEMKGKKTGEYMVVFDSDGKVLKGLSQDSDDNETEDEEND